MKRILVATLFSLSTICAAQDLKQIAKFDTGVSLRAAAICGQGREVVGIDTDGKLHVWDVASKAGAVIETSAKARGDLTCSPDGRRASLSLQDASVVIADLAGKKILKSLRPTSHAVQGMALDNGHLVAVSVDDGAPKIFNDASDKSFELARPFGGAGAPAISPDGLLVATPDEDTNVRIYDASGKLRATVDCGPLEPFFVAFSNDGKELYVSGADALVRTIDVAGGKVVRTSEKLGTAMLSMIVSGDEALLLMMDEYTMAPKEATIWNAKTNKARKVLGDPKNYIAAGPAKSGFLLVKQEDKALSVWELK
jgi:WD40 repeat protein